MVVVHLQSLKREGEGGNRNARDRTLDFGVDVEEILAVIDGRETRCWDTAYFASISCLIHGGSHSRGTQ